MYIWTICCAMKMVEFLHKIEKLNVGNALRGLLNINLLAGEQESARLYFVKRPTTMIHSMRYYAKQGFVLFRK